jgi:hypothetical protein
MPSCINDKSKTYKGDEPSPKGFGICAHAEKIGKQHLGTDGRVWQVVQDKNGTRRWRPSKESKTSKAKSKATYTVSPTAAVKVSWGEPYSEPEVGGNFGTIRLQVFEDQKVAQVVELGIWEEGDPGEPEPPMLLLAPFKYKKISINLEPKKKKKWFGLVGRSDEPKSSSALLQLGSGKFVYVDRDSVVVFHTLAGEDVVSVISPIGPSGVVQPELHTRTHVYVLTVQGAKVKFVAVEKTVPLGKYHDYYEWMYNSKDFSGSHYKVKHEWSHMV